MSAAVKRLSPPVVNALVEFLLLLLSLILPASLIHIAGFSSVADFPSDSGGSAAVAIAADAISDVVGLLAYCCWLQYFCKHPCFCWCLYCVDVLAIACVPAVAGLLPVAWVLAIT